MKIILKLSLVLAFSIVSLSAFAQDATHDVFSKHTFKVNFKTDGTQLDEHVGNLYTWSILNLADELPAATAAYSFTTGPSADNLNEVEIQWLAEGDYLVQVSEQNKAGVCTTLRRSHVKVTGGTIDLLVVASDVAGKALVDYTAATPDLTSLTTCNDKSGQVITKGSTDFENSVRHFKVSMTTNALAWTEGSWKFTFAPTAGTVTAVTPGVIFDGTEIQVPAGTSDIVLAVTVANTPGPIATNNINLNLTASLASINTNVGDSNENGATDNNSAKDAIIISASPNTTDITIQ